MWMGGGGRGEFLRAHVCVCVCARARVCRSDCVCVWCARACIILFIMKEIFSAVNKFVENKNANHQHGKPSFQTGNSDGIIHPS